MTTRFDPPPPPEDVVTGPPDDVTTGDRTGGSPPSFAEDESSTRKASGRVFPCKGCGADLTFDPAAQQLVCPFCGHVEAIAVAPGAAVGERDLNAALKRFAEKKQEEAALATGVHEARCEACGATVQFTGTVTAMSCAYCAAPIQREGVHDARTRVPVDGVLPFRIEEPSARQNLKTWIRKRWFLPAPLKRDGIQAGFRGVYLPFFTFDAFTVNEYSGMRGQHYTVVVGSGKNRTVITRTRWWPAAGSFKHFFDDMLETAGSGLPDKQMTALEPWPLTGLKPFSLEYLSGFLARTYDRPLERCFASAKERMESAIEAQVRQRIGGDVQRVFSINTTWPALAYKHLLLPIWLATFTWKSKSYRIVVNAATGEVQGERPWSLAKILLFVLVLLAVAGTIALVVAANQT